MDLYNSLQTRATQRSHSSLSKLHGIVGLRGVFSVGASALCSEVFHKCKIASACCR